MALVLKSNVAFVGNINDLPAIPDMRRVKNALSIVGTRRLTNSYTGALLRVRRTTDNAELDIGYSSGGKLDTVKLLSFVGTANGAVTTLYDQSGKANNASRATAIAQPLIVVGGVLQIDANGQPCLQFGAGKALFLKQMPTGSPNYIAAYIEGKFDKVGFAALHLDAPTISVFSLVAIGSATKFYYRNSTTDTLQQLSYDSNMSVAPQKYFSSIDTVSNKATIKDAAATKTAALVNYVPIRAFKEFMIGSSVPSGDVDNMVGYMTAFAMTTDAASGLELMNSF